MHVVGTAGHVDHGKSALVKALTGIDPDRLTEEKERGLTIDIGFAWLALPSGEEVSIVDVPGHERFIHNMLVGVGGIDLALLVVAADEGVMPQTREHLAIIDLLGIQRGLTVITKKDLVENEWLELVAAEVEELLESSSLRGSPIVSASATTGEGLPEVIAALDAQLKDTPLRPDRGRPRLPIDRVFSASGFGTVVTGTLLDGRLTLGLEMENVPGHRTSRVRGLQTHRQQIEEALPGSRVAVNLAGVAREDLRRGQVITTPGWLTESTAVDVRLRLIEDLRAPLHHNASVTFHSGTEDTPAKVRLLDADRLDPGDSGWAQLRLAKPVALTQGDGFILRSSWGTVGGGRVVATQARRHRRFHEPTLEALGTIERGSPAERLLQALQEREPAELSAAGERSGLTEEEALEAAEELHRQGRVVTLAERVTPQTPMASATGWAVLCRQSMEMLESYHSQFPLRAGAPKEELRSRLRLSPKTFSDVLRRLVSDGVIAEEGALIRLPAHRPALDVQQQRRTSEFLRRLAQDPYSPPTEDLPEDELLNLLVTEGQVVRVAEGIVFLKSAYDQMVERVLSHLRREGKISVAQVRDMFGTSRKYALALMEHLDEQRITRRVGDERVLR